MESQYNLSIIPTFEPTGSPTNNSTPTYAPTQTPVSRDSVSLVIMMTLIFFIIICVLYTYCRSRITERIEVERTKKDKSRFSSVIIF
jgi:hypothetical protein